MTHRHVRLFLALALLLSLAACATQSSGADLITAEDLKTKIESKAPFQLVDVRTPGEYAQGHLPGATNIPLDQVLAGSFSLNASDEIVVYCRTGHRSGIAARYLREHGFTHLKDYSGSWVDWTAKKFPVEKD